MTTDRTPTIKNLPAQGRRPEAATRLGNLPGIIERISQTVDEETAAIRAGGDFDLKTSNARKSRYLYELTRATRGIEDAELLSEHRAGIERLREKLASNEAAIRAHMSAVGEIAALMQDVIQRAETDGTYTAGEFGGMP
jgi:hypothetical protein